MSAIHPSQLDLLVRHAPFDRMEREHLLWMLERMHLGYYPQGEVIAVPEQGEAKNFYVIKQGLVQGGSEVGSRHDAVLELHEGECFPLGALLARRPVASSYRAAEDVFCFELGADDFLALVEMSLVFKDFCTRRIAALFEQSSQAIQAQFSQAASEQQSLASPLSSILRREPVSCAPGVPIREVLAQMRAAGLGSMVVVDRLKRPVGIFTLRDLRDRVVLAGHSVDLPIAEVMTPEPRSLPSTALAYEAAMAMAQEGFRHVLVTASEGTLLGILSERDLFSLQRVGLRQISAAVRQAGDIETLVALSRDIRELTQNMLAQGVAAEHLTQIVSTLNDALSARLIELECEASGLTGTPLHQGLCWLVMGSGGRFEQTLSTDQDNALLFSVPEGMTAEQVRVQLLPVAQRVNQGLARCGFPLCKGEIMASNPKWCLSLDEWKRAFSSWIFNGTPEALLHATIFFDFRPLYGAQGLAEELRSWLGRSASGNTRFLHQMADNALRNRPPLGLVRDFVVGKEHTLDLKLNGITPFVDAARIFALATGVAETGTIQRLRRSASRFNIHPSEVEAWVDALLFIQMLRLRHHHDVFRKDAQGSALDNAIDPEVLNELDRRILKEAFRQARKLQARLALEYQL